MRIPKITKNTKEFKEKISIIDVKKEQIPPVDYIPDVDMEDEKSIQKYVKALKAFIRGTKEYGSLMNFLKYNMDMNQCLYLPNVKQYRGSKISIEQHHLGGTITEVIDTVLRKRNKECEDIGFQSVAKEVMLCHYKGMISLVPLSTTVHQLIHADDSKLFIPIQHAVFGDSKIFYEEYKEYMHKDTKGLYDKYFLLSEAFDNIEEIIPEYLNINIIYYNQEGVQIPRYDKILELIEEVA